MKKIFLLCIVLIIGNTAFAQYNSGMARAARAGNLASQAAQNAMRAAGFANTGGTIYYLNKEKKKLKKYEKKLAVSQNKRYKLEELDAYKINKIDTKIDKLLTKISSSNSTISNLEEKLNKEMEFLNRKQKQKEAKKKARKAKRKS